MSCCYNSMNSKNISSELDPNNLITIAILTAQGIYN